MNKIDKQKRCDIVNEIIKEIARRSRGFFSHENNVAFLFLRNGKIFYKSEWSGKEICLSIPTYISPKGWHHGGTLLHLTKEFRDFIRTGEKKERGGLFSSYWGYPDEDMSAIQNKAKELEYLK